MAAARAQLSQAEDEKAELKRLLEEARRAGKRQAAPFSKGAPKAKPKKPGRRKGNQYGPKAHRPVPDHVDEVLEGQLPPCCPDPDCQGELEQLEMQAQYQQDIPEVRPRTTRIDIPIGRCKRCGKRVQGQHPRQVSQALGAAGSHLGPRVLALGLQMHKALGVPLAKTREILKSAFGMSVTPGGLCQAEHRLGRAFEPTYQQMKLAVRTAAVVAGDETGWRVAARLWWLWVFVTETVTVYAVLPGRGFEEAASILGEEFAGHLERDGWAPYRGFAKAGHQTCLAHIGRRCHELLETAKRGAARVPHAVLRIVQDALRLRDRRDAEELSAHGLLVAIGRLEARLDRLLEWKPTVEDNRKLLKHLRKERDAAAMFSFLRDPQVEATNWRAEQAIRPAVVTRKICGGNRTPQGAETQQILMSVLRTCRQQGQRIGDWVSAVLHSRVPIVLPLIPPLTVRTAKGP